MQNFTKPVDSTTAIIFLTELSLAGLNYHPDDSAADCLRNYNLSDELLDLIECYQKATFNYLPAATVHTIALDLVNAEPSRLIEATVPNLDIPEKGLLIAVGYAWRAIISGWNEYRAEDETDKKQLLRLRLRWDIKNLRTLTNFQREPLE